MKICIVPTERLKVAEILALETLMDLGGLFYEHGFPSDDFQPAIHYGHPSPTDGFRPRTIYFVPSKSGRILEGSGGRTNPYQWKRKGESLIIEQDIVRAAASLLTLEEEHLSAQRDRHDRFCGVNSGRTPESLRKPHLNAFSRFLVSMVTLLAEIGGFIVPIKKNPYHGKSFALCISHDVDAFDITRPEVHCFDRICQREEALGVRSSFYFCITSGKGYHPDKGFWDPPYTIHDSGVTETMSTLIDRGNEIGLHGSYDSGSYRNGSTLFSEKQHLENLLQANVYGGRQHYLLFRDPDTWEAYEASGMLYDSSLGYHDRIGFRAGVAAPFRPLNLPKGRPFDLWELPLIVMDGALFEMETDLDSSDKKWSAMETMLSCLEKYNGAGGVLWHQRVFAHPAHIGWEELYWAALKWALDHKGFVGTSREIVEAWQAATSLELLSSLSVNGTHVWRFRSPYQLSHLDLTFVGSNKTCPQIFSDLAHHKWYSRNEGISLRALTAGEGFTISTAPAEKSPGPRPMS